MKTHCQFWIAPLVALATSALTVETAIAEEVLAPMPIVQVAGEAEADGGPQTIQWRLLAPQNGKPFNDPFANLTRDQLADLSYVVRVRRLTNQGKISADGLDASECAKLARKLENEGVDINWLMAQRERIRQHRGQRVDTLSESIAESLQGKKVTLTGYVIPITVLQERLTEFFLVPSVAACSHEDAPPRLQVVFVRTEQGIARPPKNVPVRVTGSVEARVTTGTLRNGNGQTPIRSAYAIASAQIETYQSPR
jgi:hypothetical protein